MSYNSYTMNVVEIEIDRKYIVCHGCLSANRKFSCSTGHMELFSSLLGDQQLVANVDLKDVILCWECTAQLKKIKKFQKQIRNAQLTILGAFCKWDTVNSLSNLAVASKDSYDQIYQYDETFISSVTPNANISTNIENITEVIKEEDNVLCDRLLDEIIPKQELVDFNTDHIEDDNLSQFDNEILDYIQPKTKKKKHRHNNEIDKIKNQSIRKYEKYAAFTKKEKIKLSDLKNYYEMVCLSEEEIEAVLDTRDRKDCSYNRMPFKCTVCRLGYKRKKDLNRHNAFHHNESPGPYKCAECGKKLPTKDDLRTHWRQHNAMYKCIACGELCKSRGEIRKHVNRTHTSEYRCKECNALSSTLREFSMHYKNVHQRLICDHCGKGYFKKSMLEGHIKRNHLPPTCEVCNRTYTQYHCLENHMRSCHPRLMRGAYNIDASYCVECDKQFPSVYKFKRHIAQSAKHTPQKRVRIPCPECGKIFTRKTYMNNHYRLMHLKDTKHYCDLCNKFFATGYIVRKHRQYVHEKRIMPKTKMCDICGRGFGTNRILANHRRTHTGERPYKCPHCAATFAQSTAMHTHVKTQHKNVLSLVLQPVMGV